MEKTHLLPGTCLVSGIIGIILRRWQLATAFEPGTGLPIAGSTSTLVLGIFCALVAAILLLLSKEATIPAASFGDAFQCGHFLYFLALCASGALTIAAGVFSLLDWSMTRKPLLLLFAVGAFIAGLCTLIIGAKNYKNTWRGRGSALLLAPPFNCCLWLMLSYQNWARDPVVADYVFALFSVMACMLACYYICAHAFSLLRPSLTRFTCSLAILFSLIALADMPSTMDLCMHLAMLLYILPNLIAFLGNSARGKRITRTPSHDPDLSTKEAFPQ